MEQISGVYLKTTKLNYKNYNSIFILMTSQNRQIKCVGICQTYPIGTPIQITGEWIDNTYFKVDNITLIENDLLLIFKFLTSSAFGKVSNTLASKLALLLETDGVYNFLNRDDAMDQIMAVTNKDLVWAQNFTDIVLQNKYKHDLLLELKNTHCGIREVNKIYEAFGQNSLSKIQENPYLLINKCKISFEKADSIAAQYGISAYSVDRQKIMLKKAMDCLAKDGNTKVSFNQLYKKLYFVMKNSAFPDEIINEISFLLILPTMNEFVYEDGYFYYKYLYNAEKQIAYHVQRLKNTATKYQFPEHKIPLIERKLNVIYDNSQKRALTMVNQGGVCILTGPPGSGKTSTLKGIIESILYVQPNANIRLAATTGCAAQKMAKETEMVAVTANRLLEPLPESELKPSRTHTNPLECDVLIVDEISMADTILMSQILDAMPNHAMLILVGDKDQLQSVGPGQVLHDLIQSGVVPVYQLLECHRQKADSVIYTNAQIVKNGQMNFEIDHRTMWMKSFPTNADAWDYAEKVFQSRFKQKKYQEYAILSFVKEGEVGCNTINQRIHTLLFGSQSGFKYDNTVFCKNDRIMMLRNNNKLGYYNGDMGIVETYDGFGLYIRLDAMADDDESLYITEDDLDDIALAYAKTVHKAQGSDAEYVILIVPDTVPVMLTKEILYTGMTRAKKGLLILNVNCGVQKCIVEEHKKERSTGLVQKLLKTGF